MSGGLKLNHRKMMTGNSLARWIIPFLVLEIITPACFKSYSDYEIEAKIPLPLRRGKAVVLYPEYISRICVLPESRSIQREQENFTKLRDKGIALSKKDWQAKLTTDELAEQEKRTCYHQ